MSAFQDSAGLYDVLADRAGRIEREGPLLRHCLEAAPGRRVADIACGTGLHAHYLAEAGAEVDAFDLSGEMVAYACRRRSHARIRYRVGDMRTVQGGPWDLVACLGNSLSLLSSEPDLAATLAAINTGLSPGGRCLVHVLNYSGQQALKPRHRVEVATWEDVRIVAVKSLVPDGDHTLLTLNFFVEERGKRHTVSEAAVQRNWTLTHLARAGEQAGLTIRSLWGGFDRQRYQPDASPDLLILFAAKSA